jgi:nucleoside-triphosphatase THEP1
MTMSPLSASIATVIGPDSQAVQSLFESQVKEWCSEGVRVVGLVAEAHALPDRSCAAGFLRDIASEARFAIYLETPPSHTSCHLDGSGVDAACVALLGQIEASDVVILSKFGKLEGLGGGLRPAFETAAAAGKPILTTVSEKHRAAWAEFTGGTTLIADNLPAIHAWWAGLNAGKPLAV